MSGPIYNTQSFFETSDNGRLRLKMDLVRKADVLSGQVHGRHPVFSLEETDTGRVFWTREGDWRTDFTKGLFVSDEGWSILHLGRDAPRLHVMTPDGGEVLFVRIQKRSHSRPGLPPLWGGIQEVWIDEHVRQTTAGTFWTMNARIRFVQAGAKSFFVCRTGWGRYLVLDLTEARVVSEEGASPELSALLRPADQCWALEVLKQACRSRAELERAIAQRVYPEPLPPAMGELYHHLETALGIVRQDRVKQAIEHLVELQDFQGPLYRRRIVAAPRLGHEECHCDDVRQWTHLAMLAVGAKPRGHAIRHFGVTDEEGGAPFLKLPECIPDRERLLVSLQPGAKIDAVVSVVGAPEAILGRWDLQDALPQEAGAEYERWDYDELDAERRPVGWGLLWRRSTADECLAELVSVTRIEWTDAYREMREECL